MLNMGKKSESSTLAASSFSAMLPPSPPWTELPEDLTANILQRLHTEEILESAQKVCTTWWRVCKNPAMWRVIDLDIRRPAARNLQNGCSCIPNDYDKDLCYCAVDKFENICRCAVDRSQGQLVELKLASFEVDCLLKYIADRSCQIRCLTLTEYEYYNARVTNLTLHIKKLTKLEELHLTIKPMLSPQDFETIGISCPILKSFTYHNCWTLPLDFSGHVAAIGKTMPNLCHLRLCEHSMENNELEPILDGCPNLKSVDLRRCSHFDQRGKRCSDQIEDMWLHTDSISFKEWIMKPYERQDSYYSDPEYECCDDFISYDVLRS